MMKQRWSILLKITQPICETKPGFVSPQSKDFLLCHAVYQKDILAHKALCRQFYLDFLTHPSPWRVFSFQGQLLFFFVYVVSYSQSFLQI